MSFLEKHNYNVKLLNDMDNVVEIEYVKDVSTAEKTLRNVCIVYIIFLNI